MSQPLRDSVAYLQTAAIYAVFQDGADLAHGGFRVVAQEVGGADALLDLEPHGLGGRLAGPLPGFARLLLLLLHRRVEGREIDRDAARLESVLSQVEGKAEGVVELEGGVAGEHI